MSFASASPPGTAMSWDEFESYVPPPPSEYVDGRMIMVPPPTQQHQRICQRLFVALNQVVPSGLDVMLGSGWKPGSDAFVPDVIVHSRTDEPVYFTGTPLLVVEVLSTNRTHDLALKVQKYAAAGAPHYWIVDPRDRVFDALELADGVYTTTAHLEGDDVAPAHFGSARLVVDLAALFDG